MSKCQYYGERNKNLSKEQKQKLVEYIRNYYITQKMTFGTLYRHFKDPSTLTFCRHF